MDASAFFDRGWVRFPHDPAIAAWAAAALPIAEEAISDPDQRRAWLRCNGTWFAGVNALPNDENGAIPAKSLPSLRGNVIDFVQQELDLPDICLDPAQISVCYPGYPAHGSEETSAAHRYRMVRDAAHIDGLRRDAARRRFPQEFHGFILGIPLDRAVSGGAPFVIYEGSHQVMRHALTQRLGKLPPDKWHVEDVTEAYVAARRDAFENCARVEIPAQPGEAYVAHRLSLHGVAPWRGPATGQRTVAYFRPDPFPRASPAWWLERP